MRVYLETVILNSNLVVVGEINQLYDAVRRTLNGHVVDGLLKNDE